MNPMTHPKSARISGKDAYSSMAGALSSRQMPYVCGLNHSAAPMAMRERYALLPEECGALVRELRERGLSEQAMVLSTCNRTEIYAFSNRTGFALELREAFIKIGEGLQPDRDSPPVYEYEGIDAVRHLFAVGAGLDSMILGENQIKQQIQQAFEIARGAGGGGSDLHRLVEAAHRVGKQIRTQTDLNVGTLCTGKASVLKGEHVLGSLRGKVCLVIGAGKVGKMAARAIAERQPARLWIVNRTLEKAQEVAEGLGAEAYGLESLTCLLPEAEFILGAAYSPELILNRVLYERFCPEEKRPDRVCIVDAAVPRIIDPLLGELRGVQLFDIEHMEEIITENRHNRSVAAAAAWKIVEHEVEKYRLALQVAELAPIIGQLHKHVDRIFSEEQTALAEDCTPEMQKRVEATHHRIKQRLMHEVIAEMKNSFMPSAPEGHGRPAGHEG